MKSHSRTKSIGNKYAFWPVWVLCGVLLLIFLSIITRTIWDERPKVSDIAVVELPATSEIRFHAADFPTGQLRLFRISGTGISIVMKRLADGRVHAALTSCTACSRPGRKSYTRQNELVCGTCNHPMRFENDANTASDARNRCSLPEIPVSEGDGRLMIAAKDVVEIRNQALMK
jgi:hypothetical protein